MIILCHFREIQDNQSVVVCPAGKILGENLIAIFAFELFGAVAEKFNFGAVQGFAGDGIGGIIQNLPVEGLFYEGCVADPDNDAGSIAVADLSGQQIGSGLIQRLGKINGDSPVPVSFIRLQFQIPFSCLGADVAGLTFLHQAPADVVDAGFVPVQTPWAGADIVFNIFKQ